MIDLSTTAAELHHHLRLNREFRSDLQWWSVFCPRWNGVCALMPIRLATPDIVVHSDAFGSWGFGAILDMFGDIYLAAVRNLHLIQGAAFPGLKGPLSHLQLLLRGIKRVSSHAHRARPRLPITPAILWQVVGFFLGAACGSPYIVFISTSGMLRSSDISIYIYIYNTCSYA